MIIDASYGSPNIKPPLWAIDPGIVAYNTSRMGLPMFKAGWAMWENAGGKIYDLSGNKHHGDLVTPTWEVGGYGSALKFNGSSDYINVGNISYSGWKGMTIFARINASGWFGNNFIINTYSPGWFFGTYEGDFQWSIAGGAHTHNSNLSLNQWYDLVGTYDLARVILYIDGVEVLNEAQTGAIETTPLTYIGRGRSTDGFYWIGLIDSILIYDTALTSSQVTTLSTDPYGLVRQPSMEASWAYYEAVVGVAPTGALYGPLVGPLGGPV